MANRYLTAVLLLFLCSITTGTTYYVDEDDPNAYQNIQDAINDANDGDTIIVTPGTYTGDGNRDIDFLGKAITLKSQTGPEYCIIDCNGTSSEYHRGFYFHSGEDTNSVVDGFTITNGYYDYGGGILCDASSPAIINCKIIENWADYYGGICCRSGSNPLIFKCNINSNHVKQSIAGIGCVDSDPNIIHCTISDNTSTFPSHDVSKGDIGGVSCYNNSSPNITNCIIKGNRAKKDYGGIRITSDSYPNITNCIIIGNCAKSHGGVALFGESKITNCIIWNNIPTEIYNNGDAEITFSNIKGGCAGNGNINVDPNFAFDNEYFLMPGSLCIDAGSNYPSGGLPETDMGGGCRILDGDANGSSIVDMGVYEYNGQAPRIAVSQSELQIAALVGGTNPDEQILSIRNAGGRNLNWEIIENCDWLEVSESTGTSQGEIDEVILTVDITGLAVGKYTCQLSINDEQAVNAPRILPVTLWVKLVRQVPSEYSTIQAAIDDSNDGDVIIVASGTYSGDGNRDIDFLGKAITVKSQSGPEDCIIDCGGAPFAEHRGFYFHNYETSSSIIDGFSIINGRDTGGAILCDLSNPTICNCIIRNNISPNTGGGIYLGYSNTTINNCLIVNNTGVAENTTSSHGGGISCIYSSPIITNCTIIGNTADLGGGIYCNVSSPVISNCILWGDTPDEISVNFGSSPFVTFSNVQGGRVGQGNIDIDPGFAASGDFHLSADSPCVDAGKNDPFGGLESKDLDGSIRLFDGNEDGNTVVDMGAYEYCNEKPFITFEPAEVIFDNCFEGCANPDTKIVYLKNNGGGTLNWGIFEDCSWLEISPMAGESAGGINEIVLSVDTNGLLAGDYSYDVMLADPNATNSPRYIEVTLYLRSERYVPSEYPTIQDAIDDSNDGDIVIIAPGTYTGEGNRKIDFLGKAITVKSQTGPEYCIIDCNGTRWERYFGFNFHNDEDSDSIIDGLSIINGYFSGIYCHSSSPTIQNCRICYNHASNGGGINCYDTSLIIRDSLIAYNTAEDSGGGIYCGDDTNIVIENCIIKDNSADEYGGVYNNNGPIVNCEISSNKAIYEDGGGLSYCDGEIRNCIISGNFTKKDGGGLYHCDTEFKNCTIVGNIAKSRGGGIFVGDLEPKATNCILWDNTALQGSEIYLPSEIIWYNGIEIVLSDSKITLKYCNIEGEQSHIYIAPHSSVDWGTGNINSEPYFNDYGYWDPNGTSSDKSDDFWVNGDYHLKAEAGRWDAVTKSWIKDDIISSCIDAGDPNLDWTSELWPHGKQINMGAYGNTPQASMSLLTVGNKADLNNDNYVDEEDLALFIDFWLKQDILFPEDINRDGLVNFSDFAEFTKQWLWEE